MVKKGSKEIMGQQVSYLVSQKWTKVVYSVKCSVTLKTSFQNISADSGKVWVQNIALYIYDSEMAKFCIQR